MSLLDLFFPRRCVSCRKIGKYICSKCYKKIEFIIRPICPVCGKASIDGFTHPRCQTRYTLDGMTSFFHYDGVIRQAIKSIKYRFVSDLALEFINSVPKSLLIDLTMKQCNPVQSSLSPSGTIPFDFAQGKLPRLKERLNGAGNKTILVPIPLHRSRLRFRGFNQAEVLGGLLAKRLNIPIQTGLLRRVRKTIPQVEMKDRKKRLKNMENVFSLAPNPPAGGSQYPNILLFDDVFTTGATLHSAAKVLKRAGAKKVWGVVLARG